MWGCCFGIEGGGLRPVALLGGFRRQRAGWEPTKWWRNPLCAGSVDTSPTCTTTVTLRASASTKGGIVAPSQLACPLLVPAGGTQQQGLGMEKLNGPNSPWSRILPSQG